ncbi:MAG TPA: PDZ domain-containing protein, partial [candidate division Zixibacteria bacterium]|nr:PDZ domain-containing protein [candidate division Zixibacteria bacterium]
VSEFGDSDSLQVGQQVMALGSPLALARSVTFGVISTRDRYFPDDTRLPTGERTGQYNLWLQTDAAINPGNSGGPLVDLDGRIVGINSRATVFANNIGYSIPSNIVREVTSELIKRGKVERSWIGIHCQPLHELEGWFGSEDEKGVLIASIDPDSPAQAAKLRAGDIIQSINNQPVSARFVEQIPHVYRTIAEYTPGSELTLQVKRRDELFTVLVRTTELGELQGEDLECPKWGCAVKAITQQMALDYQLTSLEGVYVTGVKRPGPAFSGGLRAGDVIVRVDDVDVSDLGAFSLIYQERGDRVREGVLVTVRRSGATRYVVIKDKQNGVDREVGDEAGDR